MNNKQVLSSDKELASGLLSSDNDKKNLIKDCLDSLNEYRKARENFQINRFYIDQDGLSIIESVFNDISDQNIDRTWLYYNKDNELCFCLNGFNDFIHKDIIRSFFPIISKYISEKWLRELYFSIKTYNLTQISLTIYNNKKDFKLNINLGSYVISRSKEVSLSQIIKEHLYDQT